MKKLKPSASSRYVYPFLCKRWKTINTCTNTLKIEVKNLEKDMPEISLKLLSLVKDLEKIQDEINTFIENK